jgi:hypothetical protein
MLHRRFALAIALGFVAGLALAAEEKNASSVALDAQASQPDNAALASMASAVHELKGSVLAELSKLSAQLNVTSATLGAFTTHQTSVNANVSAGLSKLNVALGAFSANQASVNTNVSAGLSKLSAQLNDTNVELALTNTVLTTAHNLNVVHQTIHNEAVAAKCTELLVHQTIHNEAVAANFTELLVHQTIHNEAVAANFTELLASSFTLSTANAVRTCARSSVFLIVYVGTCSAFAYRSGPVGTHGTILVSAAHCFLNASGLPITTSAAITAQSLAMPPMACTLLAIYGRPSDAALLHCPGAAGTLPLRRRAGSPAFFLPAATAGFADDALVTSEYSLPLTGKALNIRPSYVGTTLGAGRPAHSTSSYGTDSLGYRVAGVVEQGTVFCMSGGPVLDASCGVLGVNHVSLQSSGFAGLDEVDNHMSEFAKSVADWAATT